MARRLVLIDREGRPRIIALLHQNGGALQLSLRVLDREGAPRLVGAVLVRRDGTGALAVVVLDRSGPRRLILVTVGARSDLPALPNTMDDVSLALARPATDSIRGGDLLRAAFTVEGSLLLLLGAVARGFDGHMRFRATPADGLDGRRLFGHAEVVGLDAPPRLPLIDLIRGGVLLRAQLTVDVWLVSAAAGDFGMMRFRAAPGDSINGRRLFGLHAPPRLPLLDPVLVGDDGLLRWPRFLPAPAVVAELSAAFGLDGTLVPPFPVAPLPLVFPAAPLPLVPPFLAAPLQQVPPFPAGLLPQVLPSPAAPLPLVLPSPAAPLPLDGESLRRLEEGRLNTGSGSNQPR